ncbi:HpcH/HpaI aldolase family protein [Lysinibacillus sp. NPDC093688]|uniref:HpcH/HpaI aldolase family protein n=1 Tax=Lysinibacillus sp. NPDC093688 TaxID=3390577 RepID=UPI003D08F121
MRDLLDNSEVSYGVFCKTIDPSFIEAIGLAGFDFVILDREHGYASHETIANLLRAAQVSSLVSIVRTANKSELEVSKPLDMGANGVQIPQVRNQKDAQEVVEAAKFYPLGKRGVCRYVRDANYSLKEKNKFFIEANKNTMVILQLEGVEAVSNIDSILEVQNIDIIFIGPYDLSQSLGMPGQVDHPKVIELMREIIHKCKKKNIKVGTFVDTIESAKSWVDYGVKYIAYSVDIGIFSNVVANINNNLRGKNK